MASKKQIEANRLNAKRSTGPRSVEGKAASSRNALKTGLYAPGLVLSGESIFQLSHLEAQFTAEYQPVTPTEELRMAPYGFCFMKEPSLSRLHRLCASMQKRFLEILAELRRVQAANRTADPIDLPPDPMQPTDPEPTSPHLGFVPSNLRDSAPPRQKQTPKRPEQPAPLKVQ